ncbi:MAG: alpha-L-fucosidase [Bacteroidetes bacterium]|nr:alpha-L-fucosidase [Bacteroidota bacterium]
MKAIFQNVLLTSFFLTLSLGACHTSKKTVSQKDYLNETQEERDLRMAWWKEARFGLFIHWGLYAVPAGEWGGKTSYGEWIRHTAEIPLETYDQFVGKFNPVKFNAEAWVQLAKNAGMKYIVITSKHHDGFSIFDSKQTDFDIMSTPFKRDILKELADACQREGIKLCFYHSIMDWHHPDYLPRRPWETKRSVKRAKYDRYVDYMKAQLKELCTNYGEAPHVLWFDGEWENTWNSERGTDLYNYVRNLKPNILINNRVGADRDGMAGLTQQGKFGGDFGTPEQEIPATGLPGVDWESCMTMNGNWGYNRADKNFKSTRELLQNLADIASKGGNFLLNVGPTAEGVFPEESVNRLKEMGNWMKQNSESIHGTQASPLGSFEWGRVTMRQVGDNTKLYLHIFEAPRDGKLVLHGVANTPMGAQFLAHPLLQGLKIDRQDDALIVELPKNLPDAINTVVLLQLKGKPDIHLAPTVGAKQNEFINEMKVKLVDEGGNADIRYTLDGTAPTAKSSVYKEPIAINETTIITARSYRSDKPISGTFQRTFWKKEPQPASGLTTFAPGLQYLYFEGLWEKMPDFDRMKSLKTSSVKNFDRSAKNKLGEQFGFEFRGFIKVPEDGIYTFSIASDDGSLLYLNNQVVVDNDGQHGMVEKSGTAALKAGYHEIIVRYFEATGGDDLKVMWASEKFDKQPIPDGVLFHVPKK